MNRMGRPKGSKNKVSGEVRESILEAFRRLGGVPKMVEWALMSDENMGKFYTQILPKAIQQQVAVDVQHQIVQRNYTARVIEATVEPVIQQIAQDMTEDE